MANKFLLEELEDAKIKYSVICLTYMEIFARDTEIKYPSTRRQFGVMQKTSKQYAEMFENICEKYDGHENFNPKFELYRIADSFKNISIILEKLLNK